MPRSEASEYRAYVMGADEHIDTCRVFVCASDADATVWATQLVDAHDVELWSGERLITRLHPTERRVGAVSHEVADGRMVAKK